MQKRWGTAIRIHQHIKCNTWERDWQKEEYAADEGRYETKRDRTGEKRYGYKVYRYWEWQDVDDEANDDRWRTTTRCDCTLQAPRTMPLRFHQFSRESSQRNLEKDKLHSFFCPRTRFSIVPAKNKSGRVNSQSIKYERGKNGNWKKKTNWGKNKRSERGGGRTGSTGVSTLTGGFVWLVATALAGASLAFSLRVLVRSVGCTTYSPTYIYDLSANQPTYLTTYLTAAFLPSL